MDAAATVRLAGMPSPVPAVLSIAGSDSGGGAGIQADLKAFAACGVHGMTAITALTAQSTTGVTDVHVVPPAFIVEQVRVLQQDIGIDAVKIGMLGTAATVAAVCKALDLLDPGTPVVVDPVMVAESGAVLLDDPARRALVELLLPRATVITPNVPEARALTGDADDLVAALHRLGPEYVVLTGGHREEAVDLFFDGHEVHELPGPRHPDGAAHGSGLHALQRTGRPSRAGPRAAGGRARRKTARVGGRSQRPAGHRPGPRPGGRARPGVQTRSCGCKASVIIPGSMKFLRMRPGHGEQLIAEGDPEVAAEEEALVEEFLRQLDGGMWAAVPVTSQAGRRQATMVQAFDEIPRDTDRVIFFPRAAGG